MAYCTAEEVKAFGRDGSLSDAVLLLLIDTISVSVDRWCRRTFAPVTETRQFNYRDGRTIRLDKDLARLIQIITNAGQTFLPPAVAQEPRSGPPFRWLALLNPNEQFFYLDTGIGAISVTGVWGYQESVPAPVKLAAIKWVLSEYNKADVHGLRSVNAAGMSVGMDWLTEAAPPVEVQAMLNTYRRYRIEALAYE